MKTMFAFLIIFTILTASQLSYSQIPTYELQATNFVLMSIDIQDDSIELDIRIRQPNVPMRFEL